MEEEHNPLHGLLGDGPPVEDQAAPQPDASAEAQAPAPDAAVQEPAKTPERGPDGKFLAKAPEAAAPVQPAPAVAPAPAEAPPAPVATLPPIPPDTEQVPFFTAMLDEREKRQAAERAIQERDRLLAEFRAKEAEAQRANAEPPSVEEQLEARAYATNLRISRRFADKEYGKELTATVHDWAAARCDADPIFNHQMRSSDDPYEAAMQAYNRERVLTEVSPADLDAFMAWKAAEAARQAQAQASQPGAAPASAAPHAPLAAPPKSLVDAPGTGLAGKAPVNIGDGQAYAGAFS